MKRTLEQVNQFEQPETLNEPLLKKIKTEHIKGDLRGKRTTYQYDNNILYHLNLVAKIFVKSPYTSILQPQGTKTLYVSFPERRENDMENGLSEENTHDLYQYIKETVRKPEELDNKVKLFTLACDTKNTFALNVVKNEIHRLNQRYREDEVKKKEFNRVSKYLHDLSTKQDNCKYFLTHKADKSNTCDFFREFVNKNFNVFFPEKNLESLKFLGDLELQRIPFHYGPGRNDNYGGGIHVEAKGVHYITLKYEHVNVINIGLANNKDQSEGCCSGCSLEFKLLGERTEYPINVCRTSDFKENTPPGLYKPSPLVPEDKKHLFSIKNAVTGWNTVTLQENEQLQAKTAKLKSKLSEMQLALTQLRTDHLNSKYKAIELENQLNYKINLLKLKEEKRIQLQEFADKNKKDLDGLNKQLNEKNIEINQLNNTKLEISDHHFSIKKLLRENVDPAEISDQAKNPADLLDKKIEIIHAEIDEIHKEILQMNNDIETNKMEIEKEYQRREEELSTQFEEEKHINQQKANLQHDKEISGSTEDIVPDVMTAIAGESAVEGEGIEIV